MILSGLRRTVFLPRVGHRAANLSALDEQHGGSADSSDERLDRRVFDFYRMTPASAGQQLARLFTVARWQMQLVGRLRRHQRSQHLSMNLRMFPGCRRKADRLCRD
ncbi:hypothetical protein DMB37_19445 [Nocardia sp. CS682]|nr:hypothetical protein DMB37_19445 [Nocardia sp. CS682]